MEPRSLDSAAVAQLIRQRRSINEFAPEVPPAAAILEAIDLACWAPNHHRTEPWRFYLLGPRAARRIVELNTSLVAARQGERAAEVKQKRWAAVPGWLVVTATNDPDELRNREDYAACCCALQNLALYLWSRGIGIKWTTGEVTRSEAFAETVGFAPATEQVVGLIWYGYPTAVPDQQRRPTADSLVEVP